MRSICLALLLFATPAFAQPDQTPRKMLYQFLRAEAQKHFDARNKAVADLQTPAQIHERQAMLKAKFIDAIGGFPKKTPLNAKVVGTLTPAPSPEERGEKAGFHVENVIYESRPNHHVTANLYLPDGKGPFPGVLVPCGHSDNGKAAEAYQRVCILLAKNGMAALCYDPIGQGERRQLLEGPLTPNPSPPEGRGEKGWKPGIKGSTSEHTMIGIGALLSGQSCAGYRIWDGIRSIDYLCSRPEIDAKKIGCTGNSGGGTLTAYLMALDDRIACAAPSCYITSLERLFATIGPQDAEQNITGQVAFGMDHADYLTMRAPKPTLMCIASQDFFDKQGAHTSFREAKLIYKKLGVEERMSLFEFDDKHGFSKPRREAAVQWMRRWLLNKDEPVVEGKFPAFKDEQLQCTRSGQVLADFKGVSSFGLNAMEAKKFAEQRAKFPKLPEKERMAEMRRLLGLPADIPAAKQVSQKIQHLEDRLSTHQVVFETEKSVTVSGLRFKHIQPKGATILYLAPSGLKDGKLPAWLDEKYQKNHQEIWAFDLRGFGATAPGVMGAKPSYFGVDSKESFLALHLNRPLLGQRVLDALSLLKNINGAEIEIVAVGPAGPVALHIAALDKRVKTVMLEDALVSWQSVVETPISYNQLTNAVPNVLKHYDLPELESTLSAKVVRKSGS